MTSEFQERARIGGGPHFGSGLTIDTAAEQYEIRARPRAEESAME